MAAPGGGKGKGWHALGGMMVGAMLVWITGVVLLPIGLTQKATADSFDPTSDFTAVAGGCTIISVRWEADQRNDKTPFCVDEYVYKFVVDNSTVYNSTDVLTSGVDEVSRGRGTKCDDSTAAPSTHAVPSNTACWTLASGKLKSDVDTFYKCGNIQCTKVELAGRMSNPSSSLIHTLIRTLNIQRPKPRASVCAATTPSHPALPPVDT